LAARSLALGAALLVAATGAARAGTDRIVVEAYEGERPSDAQATLAPVYAELARRGYALGPTLVSEIEAHVSHDGGVLSASQIVEAQKHAEDAYNRFIDGDYPAALTHARAALDLYATAPGQLSREPALRDQRFKALVIASRSSEVAGSGKDAFAFMAELIRSYPDRPVTSADFDPKVGALYHRVKDELARQGVGTLEVKLDDPTVNIFLDEQFVGSGSAKLGQLAPGSYRVYVTKGQDTGRVHTIDVGAGSSAFISASWQLDGALHTSGAAVTFDLDKAAGADAEMQSATQLARAIGAKTVIVLSVRPLQGRRAIAGYSIDVESQTRAFAGVQVEPIAPSAETLAQLAALLAGDKNVEAPGLIRTEPTRTSVLGNGASAAVIDSSDEPHWYDDRVAWLITAAGALAIGGGAFAETRASSLDDQAAQQTSQTERSRLQDDASSYRKTGEVLLITGGVALAAGIVKLVLVPSRPRSPMVESRSKVSLDVAPAWVGVSVRF
jgi:hypothetical protein